VQQVLGRGRDRGDRFVEGVLVASRRLAHARDLAHVL